MSWRRTISGMTEFAVALVATPHGDARVHVAHPASDPVGLIMLGHGAGGGVTAHDIALATEEAIRAYLTVVLVEQPYRVAGRKAPAPPAQVDAAWTAEAGHTYYTTETYSENGRTRTRQVKHVRWEPAAGRLQHFFDDDLVCASVGVHPGLVRAIEPFPTGELKAYDPGYVAGWVVERYQIDLRGAAERASAAMRAKLEAMCARQVPGDTYRNLVVRADWSGQTFKHMLAPVWLLSYDYGRRSFQCVINGVTGTVAGEYPKSPWKIALIVLGIIVLVVLFGAVSGR